MLYFVIKGLLIRFTITRKNVVKIVLILNSVMLMLKEFFRFDKKNFGSVIF